jgi:uncharacterized protein (TIGR01568 family)
VFSLKPPRSSIWSLFLPARTAQRSIAAMGRRKFRLSDMIPNSWFHKLHDMRRAGGRSSSASAMHRSSLGARGGTQPAATPRPVPVPVPRRSSYYCASRDRVLQPLPARATTTEENRQLAPQTQSPSMSSHRRRHRVGPVTEAPVPEPPDAGYRRRDRCIARGGGDGKQSRRRPAVMAPSSKMDTFTGKVIASDTDIIFDLHNDDVPERVLRPIVTKPARREAGSRYEVRENHVGLHRGATTPRISCASEQGSNGSSRRSSVSSGRRLKTRANSPRLASSRSRKSNKSTNPPRKKTTPTRPPPLAESFAVVKASTDPRKDFRESMEEMIAAKGIRGAGDLEDLLACYLAVNAAKHHDLIVEVFEDIWTSLPRVVNP